MRIKRQCKEWIEAKRPAPSTARHRACGGGARKKFSNRTKQAAGRPTMARRYRQSLLKFYTIVDLFTADSAVNIVLLFMRVLARCRYVWAIAQLAAQMPVLLKKLIIIENILIKETRTLANRSGGSNSGSARARTWHCTQDLLTISNIDNNTYCTPISA